MLKPVWLFIFLFPTLAFAGPSTYRCSFSDGVTTEWKDGQFETRKSSLSDQAAAIVVFDQINAQKGTARVIGNAGAADIMAMQTPKFLSLVEFSETGNIVFTS